ncbi:MAG: PaaI family thioesterase [Thermodesulfobacteriota bacterium]
MRRLNPEHVRAVAEQVNACPFLKLMSMRLESFAQGVSHLEIALQEKHLQPYGVVHGGVYAAIMDAAAFWSVYADVEEGVGLTTIDIKINYLAPVSAGRLVAGGRLIKAGRNICLAEAGIEDGTGRLLAHGTATMMVLSGLAFKGQSDLPPKFLPD